MNALAHGADSLSTPLADGTSREAGLRGAGLIATALDQSPGERNRAALATGALLCAIAVDRAGIALHHVLGQTTVSVLGTPHAETYAALLPETMNAMRDGHPSAWRSWRRRSARTQPTSASGSLISADPRLAELGADRGRLDEVLDVAMARPELEHMTPGEVKRDELAAILEAAW